MESRIKCDTSRAGLGVALEQRSPKSWHTVAFASCFLNSNEDRYSVIELELLGVVWFVEFYKYYLFRKSFTIITDYRAILSIMKDHRSYKTYNSQLGRWVDRSLHFEYNIDHGHENGAGRLHFSLTKSISKSYKQIWWGICGCNNYPHSWRNCSILYKFHTTKLSITALYRRKSHWFHTCLNSSTNKPFQNAFCLKSPHKSVASLSFCKRSTNPAFR